MNAPATAKTAAQIAADRAQERDTDALLNIAAERGIAWVLETLSYVATSGMAECFATDDGEPALGFDACDKLSAALAELVPTAVQADREIEFGNQRDVSKVST